MYKSILVPIALDHTGRSKPALDAARALLDPDGSATLLHILEDIPNYASNLIPTEILENNFKEAETELQLRAKEMGPAFKAVVVHGHAGSTILQYAKDHDVDCIVIASHRPGLQDYFLGSTAARVVRHATCNVHVLR